MTDDKRHFQFFHSDNTVLCACKDHSVHKVIMDNCYNIIVEQVNYKHLSIIESLLLIEQPCLYYSTQALYILKMGVPLCLNLRINMKILDPFFIIK